MIKISFIICSANENASSKRTDILWRYCMLDSRPLQLNTIIKSIIQIFWFINAHKSSVYILLYLIKCALV